VEHFATYSQASNSLRADGYGRVRDFAAFADDVRYQDTLLVAGRSACTWGEFDAATNVTPDRAHHPTTLAAACRRASTCCARKPLAENYDKALEMTEAAERAGVMTMVNLTYRNVARAAEGAARW
jgi:predicted dehydrogenase